MKDMILNFYISFSLSNEILYFSWPQIVLNLSIFLNTLHFELTILFEISLSRFVKTISNINIVFSFNYKFLMKYYSMFTKLNFLKSNDET